MAAPRHKVKQRKRRSAKKPTKTRAFLQAGGDPRQALWHPPASPYGLIEEILYEDPWKLLVACMLLNVTSGRAVGAFGYHHCECFMKEDSDWHARLEP